MSKKKKESFEVTVDDKVIRLAVERPSQLKQMEAQKIFNKVYRDAIESDAILRANIYPILKARDLWDEEKDEEKARLEKSLPEAIKKLSSPELDVESGIKLANEIKRDRARLRELNVPYNQMDIYTAEQQADNARFNKLVSICTVYDDSGKNYFESFDDYMERSDEEEARQAATKLMQLQFNLDDFSDDNLPENKYLAKHAPSQPSSPAETVVE
jgi:hypothetical protein